MTSTTWRWPVPSPFRELVTAMIPKREKALTASPEVLEGLADRALNLNTSLAVSRQVRAAWMQFQTAGYGYLYGHQPAVRKVVDYIATNISSIGLHLYERVSSTEREPRDDHPVAELLLNPNPWTPGKQYIFDAFADFLVYDNAYSLKIQPSGSEERYLLCVPPSSVGILGTGVSTIQGYQIFRIDGSNFTVAPEEMIHWRGYNASDRRVGISKLETLRADLSEQAATQRANVDLMESGLQQRGYIKRPLEAADWHESGGRDRFLAQFAAAMQKASRGYPILEEGMELVPMGVSPKDAQMLDSRKLFNDEVASQYGMVHCPPENEEERRQFYGDVLPPLCSLFCDFLRLQLLETEYSLDNYYLEFDLDAKQMTDDRLKTLVSAAGAPIMTRNEARSELNLSALDSSKKEGAPEDSLIVPLNVLTGGKPAPGVMPVQNPLGPPQDGAHRTDGPVPAGAQQLPPGGEQAIASRISQFYDRQERTLKHANTEFDRKRWNRELVDDLADVLPDHDRGQLEAVASQINERTATLLLGPGDRRKAFAELRAETQRWADSIDRARVSLIAASLLDDAESTG